jgi:hypothetical protein
LPLEVQFTVCEEQALPDAQVGLDVFTVPFEQVAMTLPVVAPDRSFTVTDVPLSPPG